MLIRLRVKNYVLIRELELNLETGLTAVTGETGSGKSVLLGALKLILGERADSKLFFDPDQKCVVEGEFRITGYDLNWLFEKHDLDYADQTIIRREILNSGKSRSFVNDTPVTLNVLKEFATQLVDVHSQHETLEFKSRDFQFDLVDGYAGTANEWAAYRATYDRFQELNKTLEALEEEMRQAQQDLDYNAFQLSEIAELQPQSGELVELETRLNRLSNSESLTTVLGQVNSGLEEGVMSTLQQMRQALREIKDVDAQYEELYKRMESVCLELEDIGQEVDTEINRVEHDPEQLYEVSNRVNELNRLLQKHQLSSDDELIALQEDLENKVKSVNIGEDRIEALREELDGTLAKAQTLAAALTAKRSKAIPGLQSEILQLLDTLAMPDSQIRFEFEPLETLSFYGDSKLTIYFSANKGGREEVIHRSASGGELARLMLAIKSLLAGKKHLPTIIFDEIDTGVSGEVAGRIGHIMRGMGDRMQVIAITHLPQVAGQGHYHFSVVKDRGGEKTETSIHPLVGDERIMEIAQMLSGEKVEPAAMDTARSLIANPN